MFQRSDTTQRLFDILRKVNGHITYDAITRSIGLSLQDCRSALTSARRALEREHGIVFAVERGIGLQRMNDAEKVRSTHQVRQAIARKAKGGLKRLDAVANFSALPLHEQTVATINRTVFQATHDASRLAPKAVPTASPLPIPEVSKLTAAATQQKRQKPHPVPRG